jgi:tetraacyldisaccharide 4'-kinase
MGVYCGMNFLGGLAYPVSLLYGTATWVRNKLFDAGILHESTFDIPIISVGNLSAGGTGKSPHIEYLIRLLAPRRRNLFTLSRGYGRNTRGFVLADRNSTAADIGDEPCQFKRSFPEVGVAVSELRRRGIKHLLEHNPPADCILLDDAFQHRYVKPGLSILLTDYFHPYYEDHLLPSGRLREFRSGASRADIIVVTKCPPVLSPITRKTILQKIRPAANQHVYFSYLSYGPLRPLFPGQCPELEPDRKFYAVLLLAGIANTYPLEEYLKRSCIELDICNFPDHHRYTQADLARVREKFCNIVGKNKVIVTTEKDRVKLEDPALASILEGLPIYYQPIQVEFFKNDKTWFDNQILEYAGKNQNLR